MPRGAREFSEVLFTEARVTTILEAGLEKTAAARRTVATQACLLGRGLDTGGALDFSGVADLEERRQVRSVL